MNCGNQCDSGSALADRPRQPRPKDEASASMARLHGTGQVKAVQDWTDRDQKATAEHRAYVAAQVGAQINCLRPVIVAVIGQLQQIIFRAMETNGFWDGDQRSMPSKIALMHSELSEMLEANRKVIQHDDHIPAYTGEEAEAADVLIRLLDSAGGFNLRLGEAVVDKMLYNLSRPYKHDKSY